MHQIAIVYWSGTGNTEAMAQAVAQGIQQSGGNPILLTAEEFSGDRLEEFAAVAFGCPAMGAEVLEEDTFEPMFAACREQLAGKFLALFGSYGWGDGEWMRTWEEDCRRLGAHLVCPSVICQEAPDEEALESCRQLGAALV